MKLILFIGHHKAGSTALQAALARNCRALLRQDVLYPAVESSGLAMLAGFASGRIGTMERRTWPIPLNYREGHNALAFRMWSPDGVPDIHMPLPDKEEIARTIAAQIEAFRPKAVVLAAEVFSNFGARGTDLIRELVAMFPQIDDIHVIASLRRVDDYLVSWYGQRLKFGTILKPLADTVPRHYQKGVHFDYRLMLEPWMTALPEARFTIQSYDEVLAQGGSVKNFFKLAGLKTPPPWQASRRLNTSVHPAMIEFIRRANIQLSREDARRFRTIVSKIALNDALPPAKEVEMFGPVARAKMLRVFVPIHDWLSEVTGRQAFFPDLDALGRCRAIPEHALWEEVKIRLLSQPDLRRDEVLSPFLEEITLIPHQPSE
ncbi:hypothetical protein [Celeribacter sp. SCSIO 80788]|uniref:hypothetical protein n=1 Tax=Celeribacter sp. SCSIO 80788 TaxID=3117013 RepID=UPI003DA472D1